MFTTYCIKCVEERNEFYMVLCTVNLKLNIMTVGDTIKKLEKSENYLKDRLTVSDEFIDMVKNMMPYDYDRIKEKEEHYLRLVKTLKDGLNGS